MRSGRTDPSRGICAGAAGAIGFLSKLFKFDDLLGYLDKALEAA